MSLIAKRMVETILEPLLNRLPTPLRARLLALRRANPNTPLKHLPLPVRAEVKTILTSAIAESKPGSSRPSLATGTSTRPAVQDTRLPPLLPQAVAPNGHPHGTR